MLSIEYGFSTSVKRSGHAACWCAALGGIVQFGGWPPSDQLSDVLRHEGSSCPLFYMPVTTIVRHLRRADQRRGMDSFEVALTHRRQHRLRALLCTISVNVPNSQRTAGKESDSAAVSNAAPTAALLSPTQSALSATTEEGSERGFFYDEGYVSDFEEREDDSYERSSYASSFSSTEHRNNNRVHGAEQEVIDSASTQLSQSPSSSPIDALVSSNGVVTPVITVELLRQVAEEPQAGMTYGTDASTTASYHRISVSRGIHTGYAASSTIHGFGKSSHPAVDREAPPVRRETKEIIGKHTVRPLRWRKICPAVAPRTRHGHHLVSCSDRLYVIGGSYWAHGNALASSDMMYDVRKKVWQQVSSLFPPRFCAALAKSNISPAEKWTSASWTPTDALAALQAHDEQVLYYFGGLNYSRQLTNTLYRFWLQRETLEELPQYGAIPREQFKGILVCDIQRECVPSERRRGERALGRLFYLDGLQDGRSMTPYLRVYNVATGVWVRVCPSPDLVRSQVSLLQYEAVADPNADASKADRITTTTRLKRFEVVGGMPSRRGKQRRTGMCYSFDAMQQRFDYSHALPVPGLTAHCTVPLPILPLEPVNTMGDSKSDTAETAHIPHLADGVTSATAYRAALSLLREKYGVWSFCCGGNEDGDNAEQNSFGVPVGWLYILAPRAIPLSEVARVQIECLHIPMAALRAPKDELLDELF